MSETVNYREQWAEGAQSEEQAMTDHTEELLPCPHCNGSAEMRVYDCEYFVQCVECFASTAADHQSEQEAAEKWNRRGAAA